MSAGRRARLFDVSNPTSVTQLGFLFLLVVCALQVGWWVFDEFGYTRRVKAVLTESLERDSRAARLMLERGLAYEEVAAAYPHLRIDGRSGVVSLDPSTLEQLDEARRHRLNRFVWESVFFLAVIVAGMGILIRSLRHDAELRRRQQNFLAAVSHEFKSPLASARLAAETLELRAPGGEARRRLVGRLLGDIDRLEVMVANILQTANIEEGRVRLEPRPVELAEIAASVTGELDALERNRAVRVELEIPASLVVLADPDALESILRNLVSNGIKASASGGGRLVRVEARERGRVVELSVIDDGSGFTREEGRQLFEKFYRTGDELRRTSEGSGLGLYIVKRLVELQGGSVEARSPGPGAGAEFLVTLPGQATVSS